MSNYNAGGSQNQVHPEQSMRTVTNVQDQPINQNSQPQPFITRDDILKKIKRIDADVVKQLLFYESLSMIKIRLYSDFDDDDAYNFLTDQLRNYNAPFQRLDYLVSIKTYNSLPDSVLSWFSGDLRAGLYFLAFVDIKWFQDSYYGGTEFLHWIKSIIKVSTIEIIETHISIRPNLDYNHHLRESNLKNLSIVKSWYLRKMTRPKKIDWFSLEDTEQVKWGYDYLDEHRILLLSGTFFPKTIKDKYNLVLASLDILNDQEVRHIVPNGENKLNFTSKDFFIYKMRRAWNSILGTRKKAEQKSQRSISVNQGNYDSLLKLSSHYKLTPTKMVNKLIDDKYSLSGDLNQFNTK